VELLDRIAVSNGLAWSADGATFFYVDSPSRKVRRWRRTGDGPLAGEGEVVVRVPQDVGFPDGMAIDDEGCLWVAMWGGSAVHRYAPDGGIDTVVEIPTARVSSCAFAGPDLTTLVITTASVDLAGPALAADPHAGQVFAVEAGVAGPAPRRFGVATP
jgi:sugar lactone lactonase YvrE